MEKLKMVVVMSLDLRVMWMEVEVDEICNH